jgi:H+-transporting ATPase
MPVLMLMLITLLNDGTMIAIGYDNVEARKEPEKWNVRVLFLVACILGAVACISSLALLHWLLDSWNHPSLFQGWGLGGISYGQVTTSIYLQVSVSGFLTLFSARTGEKFFFQVAPSPLLLGAGFIALLASTILAIFWPFGRHTPYALAFYIWVYCIVWWLIQDCVKVVSYYIIRKFNIREH